MSAQGGAALDTGSKLLAGYSDITAGNQAAEAGDFRAAQLRQMAGQAQAGAQRSAFFEDRQARYVASHALAAAAASGGGASDPSVINIMAGIAQEGAYRQQLALYQGDEKAQAMNLHADAAQYEGESRQVAGWLAGAGDFMKAGASLQRNDKRVPNLLGGMSGGSSMFSRFGGNGPGNP